MYVRAAWEVCFLDHYRAETYSPAHRTGVEQMVELLFYTNLIPLSRQLSINYLPHEQQNTPKKSRSLLFTELFKGSHGPADGSATMMFAPRDCWPSSFAQFPAIEAEQACLLDARYTEMGRAGTQALYVSWCAETRSHLQTFFFAARSLECIVRAHAQRPSPLRLRLLQALCAPPMKPHVYL